MFGKRDHRDWLVKSLPRDSVGAEIGVFRGEFSALILRELKPRKLHLIDPWLFRNDPPYDRAWYGSGVGSQEGMDGIYEGIRHTFKQPNISIHRGKSSELASSFPDGYFDWVYVDGDHCYEAVKNDLALYAPKIRVGGFLCGDDYDNSGWWSDGVTLAVQEFFPTRIFRSARIENHQFLFQF